MSFIQTKFNTPHFYLTPLMAFQKLFLFFTREEVVGGGGRGLMYIVYKTKIITVFKKRFEQRVLNA